MTALETAFWLLVAHALCDFPLQNDYLARAKSAWCGHAEWPWALAAHSLIQGGGVALVTGSVGLGLAEAVAHAAIDNLKCAGRISYSVDQGLHVVCKLVWWVIAGYK
jgi:hypothetical protein